MTTSDQMTEYETEPVRGLPAPLPAGETLLWQGSPAWWPLARSAFHFDKIAIYFGLMIAWRMEAELRHAMGQPEPDVAAAQANNIGQALVRAARRYAFANGE